MSTRTDIQMVLSEMLTAGTTAADILNAVEDSEWFEDAKDSEYNRGYDQGWVSGREDEDY